MHMRTGLVERCRATLLKAAAEGVFGDVRERVAPFSNDDVPRFLKRLDALDEAARRTRYRVG